MGIKIIAKKKKDRKIAKQMTELINWHIVQSNSDKHPEWGYPLGKILCRSLEEAEEHIKKFEYNDLYIEPYQAI